MTSPLPIGLSDTAAAERVRNFDAAASRVPDTLGDSVENLMGGEKTALGGPYPSAAAPLPQTKYFSPVVIRNAMDVLAKIASGLDGETISFDAEEKGALVEVWEAPANRLAGKQFGETENGDLWGAILVTGLIVGGKCKFVRTTIETVREMITAQLGLTTPSFSDSPTVASPTDSAKL